MMEPELARPEIRRQIEALYHVALRLPPEERPAFVEQACAGNATLRHEIESLLSAHDRAEDFMESPALELAAELYGDRRKSSLIGQQIGRYRILGAVGAGGMGEVYRAEDPRLDREVAIKILPAHLAADPAALSRFKREARAVAALSHPNILALHDFDFDGDIHFAVMELLQGETVRKRLSREPMDWREAVKVAIAVADGLSAAHKKGIVHRDIKPDNLFITNDSHVKILDFGIARVPVSTNAGTQTQATRAGFVVGTVGYMAPEQLRGEPVEAPGDLFSLGCVLHEMVTGRQVFGRDTVADTAAAILMAEPPSMGSVKPGIPLELEEVVQRCLRKPSSERFQSAPELAQALRQIPQESSAPRMASAVPSQSRLRWAAWTAAALASIVVLAWLLRPHALAPADFTESLAILPVANQTGDPQLDYVSDGITESLINNMSQFRHLKVLARTTAFRYKGRNVDAQSAGRELNVRRVLTGTLVRRAESLNVQVDLVNVADGSEVWGHRYNEAASNLVGLPETISRNISDSLQLRLNVTEQKQLSKRHTENPEAYRLYLLGRHYWNRRDWNDQGATEKAIAYFQQAIEKDPLYALAYVGLAEAYSTFSVNGDVSQREADLKAKAAARKALEIDENVAEAYVALASIEADQWNWPEADKAFRRALELNPGNATAHHWYAEYLEKTGRVKEALVEMRRGYELDPLSPTMLLVLGTLLYDDHQYAPAVEQLRKVLALNPDSGMAYVHIAVIRLIQKSFPEAMVELDHADSRMPGAPILMALRGYVYAQTGKRQAALDIIPKLRDSSTSRHGTALDLPVLYLGLGDKDRAFEALNRSVDERAPLIDLLKVDPFFEPLHSDPRYARLLRRMNLTP